MLITLLATAVVLGVLIFVHELGHFVTAKLADIEVPRFSIGFGPKLLGFRRGETEYVLSALPLGGYVRMAGMADLEPLEGAASESEVEAKREREQSSAPRPRDFEAKSLPARTMVISAGVLMNLLFAVVAFSVIGLAWGVPQVPASVLGGVTDELLPPGAEALAALPPGTRITSVGDRSISDFEELRIALVTPGPGPVIIGFADAEPIQIELPAGDSLRQSLVASLQPVIHMEPVIQQLAESDGAGARGGIEVGDRVIEVEGAPIASWQELVAVVESSPGRPVDLVVERDGENVALTVTPDTRRLADGTSYGRIDVLGGASGALAVPRTRVGPLGALAFGASEAWRWVVVIVDFLFSLFQGEASPRSVGGPGMIAQMSGQMARLGAEAFLRFMAILSVNLAVINLLPIPVLDGGQLLFLGVEAVRGRALSLKQRIRLSQVGFVIILAIMAFAIGNDVLRWMGL